jgi:hypothetical protein
MQTNVVNASTSREIDAAFATLGLERPEALFVGGDPFLLGRFAASSCGRSGS